ncbi:LytR/AlgR family response regulator transcription factor [Kordia sp.]|uniref:LytR/AlgR family response regulator transcription factor n=1 Tax=Kordia sp. TaxID=1965332 RepID=UPI003B5ACF70
MIHVENRSKRKKEIFHNNNYIRVGSKHKGEYILKERIVYIEACENYSWLHLSNGTKLISCKSIGHHEEHLIHDGFIRIHRSFLVNLSHLKLYEPKYRLMHLKGEIVLPMSFRKNRMLSKQIKNQELSMPLRMAV